MARPLRCTASLIESTPGYRATGQVGLTAINTSFAIGKLHEDALEGPSMEKKPEEHTDTPEYVVVWETTDSSVLPVVKSVLAAAGIPYFVEGEEAMGMLPTGAIGGTHSTLGKGIAARILVPDHAREEAEQLLDQKSVSEESPEKSRGETGE